MRGAAGCAAASRIGRAVTVEIAGRIEDEKVAEKVRTLGEALVEHGVEGDDGDVED